MSGNQTFKEIIVPEGDDGLTLAFYVNQQFETGGRVPAGRGYAIERGVIVGGTV
jgi:hypothetical protein